MIKKSKKYLSLILTSILLFSNMFSTIKVSAEVINEVTETEQIANNEYEIYPKPQKIIYEEGNFSFNNGVNVIFESGIDIYTKNRLENEILKAHNISCEISTTNEIISNKTNILVGIKGSGQVVDIYSNQYTLETENLFEKTDSYFLSSHNNIITVLGKDTDSAFYGLTTLYHIFNQTTNSSIRNFKIEDYSNVVTRGFIEGYYGNPWSVQDRMDLMTYGGYYKLNAYFYAPKDDPKHRTQWRSLYTADELKWIKQLADAGNASKTRFVYGIHPFPGNDAFGIGKNEAGYQKDLADLKAKLKQVIDQGVRQVAILADDFANPGGQLGLRLVNDITTWLQTEVKIQYPDMKTTLPYIPYDYMGNGSSNEFSYLKQSPQNVQLVCTGGRVWGEVTQNFSQTFKNNTGRAPYYWINWPCSDNSKKHLLMGGNDTFLHPGVDPTIIEGIMLNPMQQSEANKSALFAVADYSWNIWDTKEQADKNWYDSFKYMDHNAAEETQASTSLREISKHMINQNMDSRVTALQESVDLAPKLTAFKNKLATGVSVKEDAIALINEFTKIKDAASYYKNNPGNEKTRDQIIYWLNCWEDTTNAAIGYLKAIIANEEGNNSDVWTNYSTAQSAFEKSKTYGFKYVDHTEYAEVGVQHIVPFIKNLEQSLSPIVSAIVDPSKLITTVISNRTDTPTGNLSNMLDNNASTEVVYKNPNSITVGTYIGVKYNKAITINDVEFVLGANANANDTMQEAKVQYTVDGSNWLDLENGKVYSMPSKIAIQGLNIEAKGVRVIATKARSNTWLGIKDITVNKNTSSGEDTVLSSTVIRTQWQQIYQGTESNLFDGNDTTDVWYKTHTGDMTNAGDYIGVDLGKVTQVGEFRLVMGRSGSADKWTSYKLEYSNDNTNWTTYKEYIGKASGQDIIQENLQGIEARYIRLTNKVALNKWVIFSEISVKKYNSNLSATLIRTQWQQIYQGTESNLFDGNDTTDVWYKTHTGDMTNAGDYIGVDLGKVTQVGEFRLVMGRSGSADKWTSYKLEYSNDNTNWTTYKEYIGKASGQDIIQENLQGIEARYIRLTNKVALNKWVIFSEISVKKYVSNASQKNLYTNTNIELSSSLESEALTKLLPKDNITLHASEYIGIKLDRIKDLSRLDISTSNMDGLKIQTSKNAIEWNDADLANLQDARYIRLIASKDVTFNLNKFEVYSNEVSAPSLKESFVAITGNVSNIFDKNFNTLASFNSTPVKNKSIVFNLGQTISVKNLTYAVLDTEIDYLRDAKFQISLDGQEWSDVITIGDGIENNSSDANSKPVEAGYKHGDSTTVVPVSHAFVKGELDTAKDARYIRILFTANYISRWVKISEILINDGAYIKTTNNPTYSSNPIELEGFAPQNIKDGNLSTAYKPNTNNGEINSGSLTYTLSENTDIKKINIVQNGNEISNAKVMARTGTNESGQGIWNELGTLNKSLTEIVNDRYNNIFEIRIDWEGVAPTIYEIVTIN